MLMVTLVSPTEAKANVPVSAISNAALNAFLGRMGQLAADSLLSGMLDRPEAKVRVPVWIAAWDHTHIACDIPSSVPLSEVGKSPEWSRRIERTERFRVIVISAIPRIIEETTYWSSPRYITRNAPVFPQVRMVKEYCRYENTLRIEESSYTLATQAILPEGLSKKADLSRSWKVRLMSLRSILDSNCLAEDSPRHAISKWVDVKPWAPTFFRMENTHAPTIGPDGMVSLVPVPPIFADHLSVPEAVGLDPRAEPLPWEEYNQERHQIIRGGKRYAVPFLGSAPPGASFAPSLLSKEASLTELERRFDFEGQYGGEYLRAMVVDNPLRRPSITINSAAVTNNPSMTQDARPD